MENGALSDEAVREQLTRVLESPAFVHSGRRRRFLSHIVCSALQGRSSELTEYGVAFAVFDKADTFDTRLDSVVRVYAAQIRKCLRAYYKTLGAADPVIMDLPAGTYVPVFGLSTRQADVESLKGGGDLAPGIEPTITVMPIRTASAEDDAFIMGIVDETTRVLVESRLFRVMANDHGAGAKYPPRKTSRILDLGISMLLQVTARRDGDRTRVIAWTVDADTGVITWTFGCDASLVDIFAAQEHIATEIVDSLAKRGSHSVGEERDQGKPL